MAQFFDTAARTLLRGATTDPNAGWRNYLSYLAVLRTLRPGESLGRVPFALSVLAYDTVASRYYYKSWLLFDRQLDYWMAAFFNT